MGDCENITIFTVVSVLFNIILLTIAQFQKKQLQAIQIEYPDVPYAERADDELI